MSSATSRTKLCVRAHSQGLRRPVARLGGPPLREQQVAVPIPLQRIQQRVLRLPFPLPPLGVGEQTRRLFPFAGGVERIGLSRAIDHHLKSCRRSRSASATDFSAVATAAAISPTSSSVSLRFDAAFAAFVQFCASSCHAQGRAHRGQRLLETSLRAQPEAGLAEDPGAVRQASARRPAFHKAGRRTRRSPRGRCRRRPISGSHRIRSRRPAAGGKCGSHKLRPAPPAGARRGSRGRWRDRAGRGRRASAHCLRASYRADGRRGGCARLSTPLRSSAFSRSPNHSRTSGWASSASGSDGSTGASSRASRNRATARRHCSSLNSTIASVSPGIAGLARSALRQSPLAGRSNRPTQWRMASRIGCPASHSFS